MNEEGSSAAGIKQSRAKLAEVQHTAKKDEDKTSSWPQSATLDEILRLPTEEILSRLNASQSGLTTEEAGNRLQTIGYNQLPQKKKRSGAVEFVYHLRNPLVFLLLFAGVISGIIGQVLDAAIIFGIVFLSVVLDVYQESKAEKSAEVLKKRVVTTATVLRDGSRKEVQLPEIVPGDIINLSAGDIVPADSRLISLKDLYVDQSGLTGESFPEILGGDRSVCYADLSVTVHVSSKLRVLYHKPKRE